MKPFADKEMEIMPKEKISRGQILQFEKQGKTPPTPVVCKEGKGVRNFSCQHYDNCLDKAAKGMWSGFTCRECGCNSQRDEEKI
jgi:hypothetical protein